MRMFDDEELVRPFQKLVDRRAHRALDDPGELLGIDRMIAPDVERAAPALVVRRDRDELEDPFDVGFPEAGLEQTLGGLASHEALCAWAGVDARRLDADDSPHARLRRSGDADDRDH